MDEEQRRAELRRKKRMIERRKRRRRAMIMRTAAACMGVLIIILAVVLIRSAVTGGAGSASSAGTQSGTKGTVSSADISGQSAAVSAAAASSAASANTDAIAEADLLAKMYDYDGAIARLQKITGYGSDPAVTKAIAGYTDDKSKCTAVDADNVPHFFFHSLLNDDRGFIAAKSSDFIAKDNDCWMCSVDEFNTMLQQMYDHGCVLIRMRDLVTQTNDADGTVHFAKNTNLMLPQGKTAVIMSEDDLCYYHAYDNQGIASKLVLDANGDVKCEYTDEQGNTSVGNYDIVPLLNEFIKQHPDFSYHNAHCIEALTGYNGVFGYRTDSVYKTRDPEHLEANQKAWLDAHPDFSFEQDVADATKIADALKAEGYEFASHTWGHRHADQVSAEELAVDNDKFVNTVVNITGPVDTIIFAHGGDIAGSEDYTADNAKYAYFKSAGYNFYANVDGSVPAWNQIRDSYVRTARIDLDGYRLYQAMIGNEKSIADLDALGIHDVASFFDKNRITPVEIPE
jgi:hypothetical protein